VDFSWNVDDIMDGMNGICFGDLLSPYAPCMEYLPTFALKITQM
jgi:hypothetical protein